MAEQKVQKYNGKDVTITQNPLNSLYYIMEKTDPNSAIVKTHVIGLARDNGYEGYGYKKETDAQYAIDNQVAPPQASASVTVGVSGAKAASGAAITA